MSRSFALVRIDNSKYHERYSAPILRADSLEEMSEKLDMKTSGEHWSGHVEDFGFDDLDFEGGLF